MSEKGVKPHNEKIQGISGKMKPKNLKDLRSYLGAVNQLIKFIPRLAQLTEPLRDLLKRTEIGSGKRNMTSLLIKYTKASKILFNCHILIEKTNCEYFATPATKDWAHYCYRKRAKRSGNTYLALQDI